MVKNWDGSNVLISDQTQVIDLNCNLQTNPQIVDDVYDFIYIIFQHVLKFYMTLSSASMYDYISKIFWCTGGRNFSNLQPKQCSLVNLNGQ